MKKYWFGVFLLFGSSAYCESENAAQSSLQYVLLGLLILGLVLAAVDILRRTKRPEESSQYRLLAEQHERVTEEASKLRGSNEQLQQQMTRSETQLGLRQEEINRLTKKIAELEASDEQRRKDADSRIANLENSRRALDQERTRVLEAETKARDDAEAARTRIWSLHEESSRAVMKEICQKSDIALPSFDNNNLPEGFDPKLKPDFMVRLLDQYVIFDTKSSQSQNLSTYLRSQVQTTAKKIRSSESNNDIYKTVFFVIPDIGLKDIKETFFVEQGISFCIIPIQAFEPIVRTLKRLEDYDLADKYDPQERENIVNVLATFDQYVRQQNALNIFSTIRGIKVMSEKSSMPEDVQAAVETRRTKLRLEQASGVSMKKVMDDPELQIRELQELIAPKKPEVDPKDL